ncbi:MAG: hypothetical protein OEU92_01515 [Alphaproteobacteria bacterium]|nr:hypothetical protein [Alphaproteobacteria bacterium]
MSTLKRYRKKTGALIKAVQLNLETAGFTYEKWGGTQQCKPKDWLVDNAGDVYTIDADVFKRTYRHVAGGQYEKSTTILAELADHDGSIKTKEGVTHYKAGDYLVYNERDRKDGYAVTAERFDDMYELVEDID